MSVVFDKTRNEMSKRAVSYNSFISTLRNNGIKYSQQNKLASYDKVATKETWLNAYCRQAMEDNTDLLLNLNQDVVEMTSANPPMTEIESSTSGSVSGPGSGVSVGRLPPTTAEKWSLFAKEIQTFKLFWIHQSSRQSVGM